MPVQKRKPVLKHRKKFVYKRISSVCVNKSRKEICQTKSITVEYIYIYLNCFKIHRSGNFHEQYKPVHKGL